MKSILLISVLVFISGFSKAQDVTVLYPNGNVTVTEDTMIKVLMEYSDNFAAHKMSTSGYRIQLASGSNRKNVLDMKAQFTAMFPDTKAYVEYQQPTFKLRVGDFESRISAYAFQQQILNSFPNGFIVQDQISLGEEEK